MGSTPGNLFQTVHSLTCVWVCVSRSVVSDSLWPLWIVASRLLCPWGFSRQEYWSGFAISSSQGPSWPTDWPALQVDSLSLHLLGSLYSLTYVILIFKDEIILPFYSAFSLDDTPWVFFPVSTGRPEAFDACPQEDCERGAMVTTRSVFTSGLRLSIRKNYVFLLFIWLCWVLAEAHSLPDL